MVLKIAIQDKIKFVSKKYPDVVAYFRQLQNSEKTSFLASHIADIEDIGKAESDSDKTKANSKALTWQSEILLMLLTEIENVELSVNGKNKKINWNMEKERVRVIEHIDNDLYNELSVFAMSLMGLSEEQKNE